MKLASIIVASAVVVAAAVALIINPGQRLPYLDSKTDDYFSDAMTKAGTAYGICRLMNATVSVIKESHVQLEPAGLGISIAAGQALDPLDDMTERASDILVTAIISLGIQKIAYELSVKLAPLLLGASMMVFAVILPIKGERATIYRNALARLIIIFVAVRLCLPVSALISSYLDHHYFSPEIQAVENNLKGVSPDIMQLEDIDSLKFEGVFGTIKNGFAYTSKIWGNLRVAFDDLKNNLGNIITNLLKLSYLYLALFLMQVIILPIGTFWLLSRLINTLFDTTIPTILRHKNLIPQTKGAHVAQ